MALQDSTVILSVRCDGSLYVQEAGQSRVTEFSYTEFSSPLIPIAGNFQPFLRHHQHT
ncbi:hypothetical protein T4D_13582 [Trichinella pseudospiralis]|uniref:Uncharacterized protein n=1 Tax=Trichinella pseudospiralis TaxID=6337 RepID=A0A0V1FMS6_TRIPS|nr:hypothetical protein T4D_13582 [Trichinella pseudospiralis]